MSDALDMLGLGETGLLGLTRMSGVGGGAIAGPAYTLRFVPVEAGRAAPAADYIDDVPPGSVVVMANDGITYCTVWGDLLAVVALSRGIKGTVIDGMCRDLGEIRALGYPLWSKGSYMKSGKQRVRLEAVQVPVTVCGVRVEPGDLVVADDAGALTVPADAAEAVADRILKVAEVEAAIRRDLAEGVTLREARARHGYNALGLVR